MSYSYLGLYIQGISAIVITDYTEDIEVIFEMHLVLFINPIKFERDLAVMSETFGL